MSAHTILRFGVVLLLAAPLSALAQHDHAHPVPAADAEQRERDAATPASRQAASGDPHAAHGDADDPQAAHARGDATPAHDPHDPHAGHTAPPAADRFTPLPPITDADRAAAFPDVAGHAAHDRSVHTFLLLDRLETSDDASRPFAWEASGWIGGDLHRGWLRSEGEREHGHTGASLELFYGRAVARWWDLLAGVRHDGGEGPSRTWAAVGVQGLAPYKFEVEATAYLGDGGRTAARVEAEYDTLLGNRLILQWQAEAAWFGEDDLERGIGSGLATVEAGVRLRYEFSRRFAPYVGVAWERAHGGTARLRRAEGEEVEDVRVVAGVRMWF